MFEKTCDQGLCGYGWCQIEDKCYKLHNAIDQKAASKSQCKAEGALLVTPMSQAENDLLWEFLHLVHFQGQAVWLGMNDSRNEGIYIKDNTKNPTIYIDWLNWDDHAGNNTDLLNSVKFNFATKTWFRTDQFGYAYTVCTKGVL